MIRILHSVSNMDRAGIETMLMNYYRHIDRSKIQFDFLCNKKKPGAYDDEIKRMGGRIYHTPGLNPAKYPSYLKCMKKIFEENSEYKIVEAHNGALGVYALHAAKVNHIPVRIFHAHGASITRDWKLPIKLVCKALLPSNMNQHFSCGIEAARCYFGEKVVERNDYELIPNAIEVNRFVFDPTIRNRIRHDNHLENKHVVGHVGRFMSQKNHTFLLDVFAEVSKRDSLAHLEKIRFLQTEELSNRVYEMMDKGKKIFPYEGIGKALDILHTIQKAVIFSEDDLLYAYDYGVVDKKMFPTIDDLRKAITAFQVDGECVSIQKDEINYPISPSVLQEINAEYNGRNLLDVVGNMIHQYPEQRRYREQRCIDIYGKLI